VVEAFDAKGHAIEQGSGVVIAQGVVVSNCHVFEQADTATASVFYHHKRLPATLRYGDLEHDLCSFTVKGLVAPPVRMGATSALKVGENAYAVGAPEGLDLTLSNGIVSSLRKVPGGVVIQTTAPISPGSSGGGLFDSRGRLIGITSYYEKKGQQLNFALPVEWIKALPKRGKTFKELVGQSSKIHADFQKGIQAESSGDYAEAGKRELWRTTTTRVDVRLGPRRAARLRQSALLVSQSGSTGGCEGAVQPRVDV